MKQITIILLLLFPGFHPAVFSQSDMNYLLIEELIGDLASDDLADTDPALMYEELISLINNPLDLNSAGVDEFSRLFFLNGLQIENLIAYRRKNGPFITVFELQYIEGFSQDDIRKLLHFVTLSEKPAPYSISPSGILRHGRHQFFLRAQQILQEQRGFAPISDADLIAAPNSRYKGSPLKLYNRYQFSYHNRVHAGFVAEKDAGEEFFRGSNPYGFDHYTMHVQMNDIGKLKTITLGDFQSSFGQGLVLWSGMAFGKSANTLGIRKSSRGLQKYSSTDENRFFRGAGITHRLSASTEGTIFVSSKKIDAGVSLTSPEGRILEVASLQNSGLHATPSQLAGRKVLGEKIAGGNFTWNHRLFKVGTTAAFLEYDAVLNPPQRIYNQFDFRGKRNANIGVDYQFSLGGTRFFGEGALSSSGGGAFLGGAMANVSPRFSMSGLYRNYARDYHAYFSNGFRENTNTANEEGFYLGTVFHPYRRWKLSAYFDFFTFPWARYGAYAPSSGTEYFFQADYNHSRNLHMYISYRNKEKPVNSPTGEGPVRVLYDSGRSVLRYHVNYFISSSVELRNRIELSRYTRENILPEKGFLLYQDILYRPAGAPLSVIFRYAVYDTDSYNARLYAYENDVLYAFSTPAYYDRGYRSYLLVQYSPGKFIDVWTRFALTRLPGRESIGTGLNEISGDLRSEIKAQVRFRF
jgi:hypothetical protein